MLSQAIQLDAPRRRFSATRYLRHTSLFFAGGFIAILAMAAIAAPWITIYPQGGIDLSAAMQPPSASHLFGTDQMGRDVLTRLVFGARISLAIVIAAVALAGVFGCFLGVVAGYAGGMVDAVIMRLVEIQYSLPTIIISLVTVGAIGPSVSNLVLVISLTNWPRFTRIVRGEAWSLRHREYVLLAQLAGASDLRIIWRHITPNLLTTIYVLLTLDVGLVVLLEATLSFMGVGIQPPNASWGTMIADGRGYLDRAWWIAGVPGWTLVLLVVASNRVGDALRRMHDFKSERR